MDKNLETIRERNRRRLHQHYLRKKGSIHLLHRLFRQRTSVSVGQLSVDTNQGTNTTPRPGTRAFDASGFSRSWVTVTNTGPAPVRAVTSVGRR